MLFWEKIKGKLPASKRQVNDKYNGLIKKIDVVEKWMKKNTTLQKQLLKGQNKLLKDYQYSLKNQQQEQEIIDNLVGLNRELLQKYEEQKAEIDNLKRMIDCVRVDILDSEKIIKNNQALVGERVEVVRREVIQTKRASKEAVWGAIYRDAISGSEWLNRKTFYPGRWAIGYQYLYVLYRILNSVQPNNILELGLGQSTSMITQYAGNSKNVHHRVVEHDEEWIEYYQKEFSIADKTQIVHLDIEKVMFENQYELYKYVSFKECVGDLQYDFISIDAPFGSAENQFSRVDVLDIIPMCLAPSFIIMIDDVNRIGEQNMIQLLEQKLEDNNIRFVSGKYVGDKDAYVIASEDKKFVCTL